MINASELRLGNYMMFKTGVRILTVQCTYQHFELLGKGAAKDGFPIMLKPDILQKCGFIENKKYYQYPEAREFALPLPVMGTHQHEIYAYINSKGESYARVAVNEQVMSNNFYHLHQLQNVYFSLVGKEMEVVI